MGKFVTKDQIAKAREMDLYTYMEIYEPDNLVKRSREYRLREHDSVVISNGIWVQKSTGIGGRSALDYLVKVRGVPFPDAVEQLAGGYIPDTPPPQAPPKAVPFQLPPKNKNNDRVIAYLKNRGISETVIRYCIDTGLLYESGVHHNAVFVGLEYDTGVPAYAFQRGCNSSSTPFRGEVSGSKGQYGFRLEAPISTTVHIHEAAIDLLSYCTLLEQFGKDWKAENQLSVGGVGAKNMLPVALETFLSKREIKRVVIHFDNDLAGRKAAMAIMNILPKNISAIDRPPPIGKDTNDYLLYASQNLRDACVF